MFFDIILNISPVIKIITVFCIILVSNHFKIPLGIALILGGISLDLWSGKTGSVVIGDLGLAMAAPELWLLIVNIALIMELGYFMASEKNSQTLLAAAGHLGGKHGRALSLILIPATIGLVPMPGGALFSAPLVGKTVDDTRFPAAWKVTVNYWFRHILEYWWPLYPVIIISLSIFSLAAWKFIALQITFTIVSILAGWFFLLRRYLDILHQDQEVSSGASGNVIVMLLPLLIIVLCTMLLPTLIAHVFPSSSASVHKLLGMLTGLILGIILIGWLNKKASGLRLFENLFTQKTGNILLVLAGAMIFQAMLRYSGLLPDAAKQLAHWVIPVEIIIAFLPFLAGLVTGVAIGFGATAFPLVIGLATPDTGLSEAAILVLAFSMGYAGMMLSPIHLCYILTRRYFTVRLLPTYRYLLPCVGAVALYGIIFHIFIRVVGW